MIPPRNDDLPVPDPSSQAQPPSVGQRTAAGVALISLQKWVTRIFGLVTIAVLTRFLAPEDFGTVAAVSTLLPFFYLVADLGFGTYIVQVDKTNERMLNTGFWFGIGSGLVLAGVLAGAAPVLELVFDSADIVPVTRVLALSVIFSASASVPLALLRRAMRFKAIAVQGTSAALGGQIVAICLTLAGWGVWALVAQTLMSSLVVALLAWLTAMWRPKRQFSRQHLKAMARYGSQVLGVEFIAMIRAWGEAAIISVTLGISALGYLSVAQRLIQVIQDVTGSAVVPVTTVTFARIRESQSRLRAGYLRALRITYAVTAPPLVCLAVAAEIIIPIAFGDGWEPSHRVAQILALGGVVIVGASLDHGLLYGMGRPGRWLWYAVVIDGSTLAVTAVVAAQGLLAVAWGLLGVAIVATVVRWFLVSRLLGIGIRTVAGPFVFLVVATATSGGAGWVILAVTEPLAPLLRAALVGIGVLSVHLLVVKVLAPGVFNDLGILVARFRRPVRLGIRTRAQKDR